MNTAKKIEERNMEEGHKLRSGRVTTPVLEDNATDSQEEEDTLNETVTEKSTSTGTETNTWSAGSDTPAVSSGSGTDGDTVVGIQTGKGTRANDKAIGKGSAKSTPAVLGNTTEPSRLRECEARRRLLLIRQQELAIARELAECDVELQKYSPQAPVYRGEEKPANIQTYDKGEAGANRTVTSGQIRDTGARRSTPPGQNDDHREGWHAAIYGPATRSTSQDDRSSRDHEPPQRREDSHELIKMFTETLRSLKSEREREPAHGERDRQHFQPPPKYLHELPTFDGDLNDWIPFKSVFDDTKQYFSEIQNIARLRKALKGPARMGVKALLYSSDDLEEIMHSLKKRYGDPEILVRNEISKIKKLPRMADNGSNLNEFVDQVCNCVATIRALDKPHYMYSPEIANRIAMKLNPAMQFEYGKYKMKRPDDPELYRIALFLDDLRDRCGTIAAMTQKKEERNVRSAPRQTRFANSRQPPAKKKPVYAAQVYDDSSDSEESDSSEEEEKFAICQEEYESEEENQCRTVAVTTKPKKKIVPKAKEGTQNQEARNKPKRTCPLCKKEHALSECEKFKALSVDERWGQARVAGICYKCLAEKHRRFRCNAKPCGVDGCTFSHHQLLHKGEPVQGQVASSVNTLRCENTAYLKIIPVEIYGPLGKKEAYALLDEGSTMTLIEEETALSVAPPGKAESLRIQGIGGKKTKCDNSFKLELKIKGQFERNIEKMTAYTIGSMNLAPQTVPREVVAKCPHLNEIEDQLVYETTRPTILIGQDNWHLIASREIKEGEASQPVASYTNLGWVLHGLEKGKRAVKGIINHMTLEENHRVDEMIKEHFSIESLGVEPRRPSNDLEQRALTVLNETTRQLPDGRYESGLIWKSDAELMPEHRFNAEKRLYLIEKKFERNKDFKAEYVKQVENLMEKCYAEEAPANPNSPRTWYLPHFAVTHPQKGKQRLVFDAAARTNGRSLNDALLPGPDLLQSLFGVLARFREGRVAVIADIKEMFLQVKMREIDRDSLRFLWRKDTTEDIKEYRMSSLIFGAASSPCTAIYVKNKNAEKYKDIYPETAAAVEKHFYMDDYLQAFENDKAARKAVKEITEIHEAAKFHLRGWASNDPKALTNIDKDNASPNTATLGDKEERTLGLIWKIDSDALSFALNLRNTPREAIEGKRPPTKREVTSAVMSVFDPLGLASPITVQGRKLIQDIWRVGLDWNAKLTKELEEKWQIWLRHLKKLEGLEIPRPITNKVGKGQMHVFMDASEQAYAGAVYWQDEASGNVSLIAAKARVTPLKPVSIPRLELQAAVLGCRLAASLTKELNSEVTKTTFWTDSRTILTWIKADPRQFKPFVAHRLAEIEEKSKPQQWRWVPTKMNAADDATRDVPKEFTANHRWFKGPEFLRTEEHNWPKEDHTPKDKTNDEAEKKRNYVNVSTVVKKSQPLPDISRFSNWGRYIRATARTVQCVDVFRKRYQPDELETKGEILPLQIKYTRAAEKIAIQKAQRDDFLEEIHRTKKKQPLPKDSKLRKLCLEIDENDVLRVTGRLDMYQDLDENQKRPAILHARNAYSKLLIQHTHETFMHGNHETVINELRKKFYIVGLRRAVRKLIHDCQWCKLRKLAPTRPQEGTLPVERLSSNTPPFNCSAIDYFGPMTVTIGRRTEKRWGALITCMTTRAIHIELSSSLTPSSAIMALRRFMARRGTPSVIYSDNGTNFVRANKDLQEAAKEVSEYATARGILWKFIPPGAPHMGGAWERMIRSVKTSLAAVLNQRAPKEEILQTLLLEVDHVVNSRPLTPVQPDLSEEALTPNHFLIGRSCGVTPIGKFTTNDADSKTWKAAQHLADKFWERWVKEYTPTLLPRTTQSSQHHQEPMVGDVVLISDGTMPRGLWPRGEVTRLQPGPDGIIRIVEVRTNTGTLRRPTSRLVVLARPDRSTPDQPSQQLNPGTPSAAT